MARVGLTHGGFYAHFPSRDALLAAAIRKAFEDVAYRLTGDDASAVPAARLKSYIEHYLSRSHRDAPATGCPLPILSSDLPRLKGEARAAFGEGVERMTGRLAEVLAAIGHDAPDIAAASILAEMVGALSLARAVEDPVQSDAILTASRRSVKARAGVA
jgi:TetR/AcrR family transcriptional repressor of nem operon